MRTPALLNSSSVMKNVIPRSPAGRDDEESRKGLVFRARFLTQLTPSAGSGRALSDRARFLHFAALSVGMTANGLGVTAPTGGFHQPARF